ncbi:interleukin-13 receptor subunit alpha-2 isoform X2 [Cheilinus undulatus]|uniref:interleukin-13 receptor subunit alpha-2 isoform X2 n=1 Tax=Cheilinus undulatus TaxID=241271 RepID=UPI001BD6510F|nr:interleukin-13 receptor subunit alpha-2 isoform X2 [Cheilinus undulatus]
MTSKSWLIPKAAILLLVITWRENMFCDGLTVAVDPPEDLMVSDLGLLGHLEITWSPPASLIDVTECQKMYQLEYFNTYRDSWSAVRTPKRKYRAQFDLMKDVKVRVYTMLSGPCTGGAVVKSKNYTELIQKPSSTGAVGTAVQNFVCVYHNLNYMECKWGRGPKTPTNSQQNLYFWYKELEQAEECPKYLASNGYRSGCNFTGISLPDFTDIIICVNGSSPEGLLKPTYTSLQIQNHVKPETTKTLHLQTGPDERLELLWDHPESQIPVHCLEWEVERYQEGPEGKITSEPIFTKEMSLTLPSGLDNRRNCFRVRSKLDKYCADKGFWSEWSPEACYPATSASPQWKH